MEQQITQLFKSPTSTRAWKLLEQLAMEPFDLTKPEALNPERFDSYSVEGAGWELLFPFQRINSETFDALMLLAEELQLTDQFHCLMRGEKVNTLKGLSSEDRGVGHPTLRSFLEIPPQDRSIWEKASADEWNKLKKFLKRKELESFDTIVQIGIGGSQLGPEALSMALSSLTKPLRQVYFLASVDPQEMQFILERIDLAKTLFICVSKSGGTLETKTNEEAVRRLLQQHNLDPSRQIVMVTQKGSPLDRISSYLEVFYIWDYIGGRFSATSMVGGVALSLCYGLDLFEQILEGAFAMDIHAMESSKEKNLPLLSALIRLWNGNFLSSTSIAVIPYNYMLRRLIAHLQQLEMESNGKSVSRLGKRVNYTTGLGIWGELGTNAQHSFFQWLHQGTQIVPLEFIAARQATNASFEGHKESQSQLLCNLFGQMLAFAQGQKSDHPNKSFSGNRPSMTLITDEMNAKSLGALLAYYENVAIFEGFLWNINSFDQEGVQLGKLLANQLLAHKDHPDSAYELWLKNLRVL